MARRRGSYELQHLQSMPGSSSSDRFSAINYNQEPDTREGYGKLPRVMYLPVPDHRNRLMKIDFVLEFKVPSSENLKPKYIDKAKENEQKRLKLVDVLKENGFEAEYIDHTESSNTEFGYILLHAKFPLLLKIAEQQKLEMPLRKQPPEITANEDCFNFGFMKHFNVNSSIPNKRDMFTTPLKSDSSHMALLMNSDDEFNFFSSAQRSLMVLSELRNIKAFAEVVASGAICDYFPLHDGGYELDPEVDVQTVGYENDRQELYHIWVKFSNFYKYQPIWLIRHYFGEKLAMYFAWLGYYDMWLIPMAILGLLVFLYGVATLGTNTTGNEICEEGGFENQLVMCPLCDKVCDYWRLGESCMYAKIVYLFDNEVTILFSIIMSLWSTCFLEFWTRKQHVLQLQWDVKNFEKDELPRPEYRKAVFKLHPEDAEEVEAVEAGHGHSHEDQHCDSELHHGLPVSFRLPRYCISFATVLFMVCLVIALLVGVIVYRITMVIVFASLSSGSMDHDVQSSNVRMITSITSGIINFVCIILLDLAYRNLALFLTKLENPKTETSYEDSYTFKVYCFQFVNFYSSLFYIAFFKGYFNGRPGHYNRSWGARNEECDPAGCLVELVIQILIIFVAKQMLNNITELLPLLINWVQRSNIYMRLFSKSSSSITSSSSKRERVLKPWEKDSLLPPVDHLQLFDEYLEVVLQFGFVTLFVASMPLAPLFALLNNILEIRLDAMKIVTMQRRALARRASDIGIWLNILSSINVLSVISNSVIIGFTSEQIPKMLYRYTTGNNSLSGYMRWRLSVFDVKHFENVSIPTPNINTTTCYYRDFRHPPTHPDAYHFTQVFWHLLAARLLFIIIYEHFVLFLKGLVDWLVPDVPKQVTDTLNAEKKFKLKLVKDTGVLID